MKREWKPGDVAVTQFGRSVVDGGKRCGHYDARPHWHHTQGGWDPLDTHSDARPLAVIDPEDFGALLGIVQTMAIHQPGELIDTTARKLQAALREFANPTPQEPTDPRARVTDFRENIWRLLADGDWVCTSGPDIGEYITWSRLAAERGPLEVEVAS